MTDTLPPPTEAKTTPPPLSPEVEATVASLLKPTIIKDGTPVVKPPPKAEVKAEVKTEVKPPEVKDAPDAKDPTKSWAELRKKAEDAEARALAHENSLKAKDEEARKLREEFETYKKNPVPKEFQEKLTEAEKRAQEFQQHLRAADLARDPEFQAKYNKGIEVAVKTMGDLFVDYGVDPAEVKRAMASWNEEKFAEWSEGMPGGAKMRVNAAFQRAVELDMARQAELSDSERAWTAQQKAREAEYKQMQDNHVAALRQDRDGVLSELTESQKELMADETIRKETEALLDRVTGLSGQKAPNREVLGILSKTYVLAHHFKRLDGEKTKLAEELEATKKTLAERDAFIAAQSGSSPTPRPTGAKTDAAEVDSIVSKLLKPQIRT